MTDTIETTQASQASPLKGHIDYDASNALVLTGQATASLASAKDFIIDSADMAALAGDELGQIKRLQKDVEADRVSKVKPLNDAVKIINAGYKAPLDFLANAEDFIKSKLLSWDTEQRRLANVARMAAEAAAAQERQRQAELEAQQRAQAEEARRQADALAAQAAQAAESGDADKAVALQEQANAIETQAVQAEMAAESTAIVAATVTAAPIAQLPVRTAGTSVRTNYSAQVDDLMELVKSVAEGKAPLEAIMANDKFLNAQAKAFKKAGPLYPGVTARADRSMSARAA